MSKRRALLSYNEAIADIEADTALGNRDRRRAQHNHSKGLSSPKTKKDQNVPFCLFFRLVRFCNRAPSSGAKGWRVIAAMAIVESGRVGVGESSFRQLLTATSTNSVLPQQ
jgi:hypothetical protein